MSNKLRLIVQVLSFYAKIMFVEISIVIVCGVLKIDKFEY